jgi:NfeD-like.
LTDEKGGSRDDESDGMACFAGTVASGGSGYPGAYNHLVCGGALVAFIVSLFYDNLLLEISLFLVVSLALLIFTRPFVKKYFNTNRVKTNYEAVIGKEAIVTSTIDNDKGIGLAKVSGQEWSARSVDGSVIEKGTKVIVESISGVKLMVSVKKEG